MKKIGRPPLPIEVARERPSYKSRNVEKRRAYMREYMRKRKERQMETIAETTCKPSGNRK